MKKRIYSIIEKVVTLWELYALIVFVATSYIGFATGFLTMPITVPLWLLILIAISPLLFFLICRFFYLKRKRIFNTGDLVQIIADERKFVAIRYLFWLPNYVVCKEHNTSSIIAVHQKYLKIYQEPEKPNLYKIFGEKNINTAVNTITITKL